MKKILGVMILLAVGCNKEKSGDISAPQEEQKHVVVEPGQQIPTGGTNKAQIILDYINMGDVELTDIATVVSGHGVQVKLIGGKEADPKDWPASFTTSQGSSRCTGTVLGPQVLQLAAHCVGNGKMATLKSGSQTYQGVCKHAPEYAADPTADYALCYLSTPIDLEWYEGILLDGSLVKVGTELTLAGMGCTQPGGGGGNDNIFRIGKAPVTRIPTSDNDIVTTGDAALCFGDSGGSAYAPDANGVLKVVGINSRGDIRKVSYLSSVYTATAKKFYVSWSVANNTPICGINDAMPKCRGAGVTPPPPESPLPVWCKEAFKKMSQCLFDSPRLAVTQPQLCQDTYAKLYACEVAAERVD